MQKILYKEEDISPRRNFKRIFTIMKSTILFLLLSMSMFATDLSSQSANVSILLKDNNLENVLTEIEKQTDYLFVYKKNDIDLKRKVSINAVNRPVKSVLHGIFNGTDISYVMEGNSIMLMKGGEKIQQPKQDGKHVTGTVTDEAGEPLIGVSVAIKGTTTGTLTDLDGKFTIQVPAESTVLVFSYVGFTSQEIVVGDKSDISVVLASNISDLEEVVVVGYGVQKKKLVTGATTQVKGDDISKLSTVSVMSALSGQTPGVSISQNNNKPGEGFKVNIRGVGTIGDSNPLYIIDGLVGGDINLLSPTEIESVDILKDAASTAIYGSRAANGVILVTTKHGKLGSKITTSFDMNYGWQNVYKKLRVLNAQEYVTIMDEARMNDGLAPLDWATVIPSWDRVQSGWTGTDWFDELTTKNAPVQNYSLNINGGSENAVYSASLGYTSQVGMMGGKHLRSQYDRYNGRINTEFTLLKSGNTDILKFGENLTFAYTNKEGLNIAADGVYWNDIRSSFTHNPMMPVYDENGEYTKAYTSYHDEANPMAYMHYARQDNNSKNYSVRGNFFVTLQPIERLILKSTFGFGYSSYTSRSYIPVYDTGAAGIARTHDQTSQSAGSSYSWTLDNTATYNFTFTDNHNFGIMLGISAEKWGYGEQLNGDNIDNEFGDYKHAYLDNTKLISPTDTHMGGRPYGPGAIASYFGRLNYDYKGKYMATVNMRRDASSKFAPGHRWGTFPSISAGWTITEEPFAELLKKYMDFFKLRASWGQNGNMNIDDFQYLASILIGDTWASYTFGGDKSAKAVGSYPNLLANPDITWETSEQLDFGFDARFFNRLSVNFDWYSKTTKDWLVRAPILSSYGTGAPFINGGDISNKGFELALGWNGRVGEVNYNVNANMAHNINKVMRIANNEGIINGGSEVLSSQTGYLVRAQVGYPVGYYNGYKTDGIFQNEDEVRAYKDKDGKQIMPDAKPGDVRFVDFNGDGTISEADRTMIGNPNPDYTVGLSFGAEWKGIDFALSATGELGQENIRSLRSASDRTWHNFTMDVAANRWHGEGTSNRYPRITSSPHINWTYYSDIYVENGSYLRISNITLGYDLKKGFPKLPLQKLRIYGSIQNAFTFTGYKGMDPAVGWGGDGINWSRGVDVGYYPAPRTVLIGVNITL
jgi:TonB-linked SusC/RagA family outer membrane protein